MNVCKGEKMANTHVATAEQPNSHPTDLDDLYAVLGISSTATEDEIKKAYRQQAMKYHPDRTMGDDTMAEIFRAVQRAYDILMNPEKRKYYDETGKVKLDEAALKAEAVSVLNHNIIQAIDALAQSQDMNLEVWSKNPLHAVKQKMAQDLFNAKANLKAMQKALKRYAAIQKRFRNKKNQKFEESPIAVLIKQRIDNLDEGVDKVSNLIQIHDIALKMVDDYDYDTFNPNPTSSAETAAQMQQLLANQFFNFPPPR
jgi:curved DNA-binding protein CbpA